MRSIYGMPSDDMAGDALRRVPLLSERRGCAGCMGLVEG